MESMGSPPISDLHRDPCGEEIVLPVGISAGSHQDSVEGCPVCCHPMTLHADRDADGKAHVEVENE